MYYVGFLEFDEFQPPNLLTRSYGTLFFLYKKLFIRNLYPTQKKVS